MACLSLLTLARGPERCCYLPALSSMHVLVPCLANPSLTDAPNAMFPCLPNHACVG